MEQKRVGEDLGCPENLNALGNELDTFSMYAIKAVLDPVRGPQTTLRTYGRKGRVGVWHYT
jgi:hypothetical protein